MTFKIKAIKSLIEAPPKSHTGRYPIKDLSGAQDLIKSQGEEHRSTRRIEEKSPLRLQR